MAKIQINDVVRDMTAEEVSAYDAQSVIDTAEENAMREVENQKVADKASGNQKLLDLGLSQAEVDAITK